jgi:FtsH-binding integral membrane protein
VTEPQPPRPQAGWREVVLVAAAAVAVVLGAAVATSLLPTSAQEIVFHTPLTIVVLVVGTGWLLWRIARRGPGTPEG